MFFKILFQFRHVTVKIIFAELSVLDCAHIKGEQKRIITPDNKQSDWRLLSESVKQACRGKKINSSAENSSVSDFIVFEFHDSERKCTYHLVITQDTMQQ